MHPRAFPAMLATHIRSDMNRRHLVAAIHIYSFHWLRNRVHHCQLLRNYVIHCESHYVLPLGPGLVLGLRPQEESFATPSEALVFRVAHILRRLF